MAAQLPFMQGNEWRASIERTSERKKKETEAKLIEAQAQLLNAQTQKEESIMQYGPEGTARIYSEAYGTMAEADKRRQQLMETESEFALGEYQKTGVLPSKARSGGDLDSIRDIVRQDLQSSSDTETTEVAKPGISACPEGYHKDPETGKCVKNSWFGVY